MVWRAGVFVVVVAACGSPAPSGNGPLGPSGSGDDHGGPLDAGDPGGNPGPVDARPDAGRPGGDAGDAGDPGDAGVPPELAEICGAVPVTPGDWERCYQHRRCEFTVGCIPENPYRSVQECLDAGDAVELGRLAAELRERERAVAQGRAAIDVAAFARCLIETSGARCNTAQLEPSCATRFLGTVGDGDACFTDIECASPGATCVASCSDACCLGTCQPRFREGETCTDRHSCEPGLQCHRTCLPGDIGSPCTGDRDCDPGAWCDVKAGTCKAAFAAGSACTNLLQCSGNTSCVGLSASNQTPGHCLRISEIGDSCDAFCYGNLFCDGQTCQPLPDLDETCSSLVPCGGVDTTCSNGTCVLRSGVGAACAEQTCMPGLFCTSELGDPRPTCSARRAEGQPCAAPGHCESFLCAGNSVQPGICLAWSDTCPAP
ncbi:MAG TPA: Dickkopf N-terminal cysteine-rich domain-containing protein [Kofleriaceae bacterium]|nr:Dickkopf N-terminal cysteine-rich domain-containing protein [Kofleriaceae bacterium]